MEIPAKSKISTTQLLFMIIGFMWGSSLLYPPGSGANQDAWLVNLLALGEGFLIVLIYTAVANRFPGKTLIEISDIVCGPYLGKLFSIAFLFYIFHLGSLVISSLVDYVKFLVLPMTPEIMIALIGVMVTIVAVTAGIEVLGRCTVLLVVFITLFFLITSVLLLPQFKLTNLQPVLETPFLKLLAAGHGAAAFPYGETVVFLMIFPHLNIPQKSRPVAIWALLSGGLILTLVIIQNIGVLGAAMPYFVFPSISASRLINIGEVFTRVEVLIGISFEITIFIKLAVLLYAFMRGTAQLFKLNSYQTLAVPIWFLISLLGIHNFSNVTEHIEFLRKTYPLYTLPFQVGIPLLLLLMATFRRLPRESS